MHIDIVSNWPINDLYNRFFHDDLLLNLNYFRRKFYDFFDCYYLLHYLGYWDQNFSCDVNLNNFFDFFSNYFWLDDQDRIVLFNDFVDSLLDDLISIDSDWLDHFLLDNLFNNLFNNPLYLLDFLHNILNISHFLNRLIN